MRVVQYLLVEKGLDVERLHDIRVELRQQERVPDPLVQQLPHLQKANVDNHDYEVWGLKVPTLLGAVDFQLLSCWCHARCPHGRHGTEELGDSTARLGIAQRLAESLHSNLSKHSHASWQGVLRAMGHSRAIMYRWRFALRQWVLRHMQAILCKGPIEERRRLTDPGNLGEIFCGL